MEIVNTLDIDGTQWEMQDVEARNKIAVLENYNIAQDLENVSIDMLPGYSAVDNYMFNHYKIGKIHFMSVVLTNLKGENIGTTTTAKIAKTNLRPKNQTYFLLNDYQNKATLRCQINKDGTIDVGESVGVVQDSNQSLGLLIFAEA